MAQPAAWARSFLGLVLGARRCPACGRVVSGSGDRARLCPDCALALAPRLGGYCPVCGALCENPQAPPAPCPACRRGGGAVDAVVFHGRYEGVLRALILDFKFGGGLPRARVLGGFLVAAWTRAGLAPASDRLLVPVPLHPRRLAWRGFNQSLELARVAGGRLGLPLVPEAMSRIRHTVPQSRLAGSRRRENIQGAFAADPAVVAGRSVVLVDDVMTTGATVETAARALRQAGAVRVDVLVVGR